MQIAIHRHQIQELIWLAEVNINITKYIYSHFKNTPFDQFWLLTANNAYFESVSICHTLVCSKDKNELQIKPLLEKITALDIKNGYASYPENAITEFKAHVKEVFPNEPYNFYLLTSGDDIKKFKMIIRKSSIKDLEMLKNKFINDKFNVIRHEFSAHKNKEKSHQRYQYTVSDNYINKLDDFLKELRIDAYFWFDIVMNNQVQSQGEIISNLKRCLVYSNK